MSGVLGTALLPAVLPALLVAAAVWAAGRPVVLPARADRRDAPAQAPTERTKASDRAEQADLPHVVGLVAVGVEAGAPVPEAVLRACEAFSAGTADDAASAGGGLCDRLSALAHEVSRGADPATTWAGLADDPVLAPLARALARSARTGASVVRTLALLADDLADQARVEREDAARTVGVKAALPLGVCLLPAFLLLGIVPLVAGLASQLAIG